MTTTAVVTARMASKRLPNKVMAKICGEPIISLICLRLLKTRSLTSIVVATTRGEDDKVIVDWCRKNEIDCITGPTDDVLKRIAMAAQRAEADKVIRITCDLPFVSYEGLELLIQNLDRRTDYANNIDGNQTWQDGTNAEITWADAVYVADSKATPDFREHAFQWLRDGHGFITKVVKGPSDVSDLRGVPLMVDEPIDLKVAELVMEEIVKSGDDSYPKLLEIVRQKKSAIERLWCEG
jgi:spore coat polysaccharide biosynthesis protein SpsF (cytidylyltransferase family)